MNAEPTPPTLQKSLVIAFIIFTILMTFEIKLLTGEPWIGLSFEPSPYKLENSITVKKIESPELKKFIKKGDRFIAIKSTNQDYINLGSHNFMSHSASFYTLQTYRAALQHNALLYKRLIDEKITIKTSTGKEISFAPLPDRPITNLPLNFWVINFTALVGLLFAAAIHSHRHQTLATRLLVVTGLCFAAGSTALATYSSRSLAMAPDWYDTLTAINYLSIPLVAYSLLTLLMIYPHRLIPYQMIIMYLLAPAALWLNILMYWRELPFHSFYSGVIIAFLAGIIPSIQQWRLSQNKPVERAALMWMLLSIYIFSGCEILFYFTPNLFGHPPALPLWAAQLLFLPLYTGFILSVMRVRLYNIERWWVLSWQWALGGLLIIAIDLLLISVLHLHPPSALSIAVILVAWLYFPLRQWLWQQLGHPRQPHLEHYIHDFIQTFVGNKQTDPKECWRTLLQRIFSASSAKISDGQLTAPQVSADGMALSIPGIDKNYHINLYGKQDNSRLFNPQDIHLSQTLGELASYTTNLQQATRRSQARERDRIMRDLHDDVGANLVSMIYRAKTKEEAQLARDTLTLLRETIYTLDDDTATRLHLAIAKWRQEIKQRCQSAAIHLNWQTEAIPDSYELDARQLVNLGRVLREIFTNALKHARPEHFNVHFQIQANWLYIQIKHNGNIKPLNAWTEGKGLPGIRTRIKELHGNMYWRLADELEAQIAVPIHREHTHESTA